MKDFDADREERDSWPEETFKLAGREFRLKPQMPARALSTFADLDAHMADTGRIPPRTFETLADVIRESIHGDDRDSWDELLAADLANPLTLRDMLGVGNHIVATSTDRPTKPLSDSGTTGESGGTRSTADSDSPEAKGPRPSISAVG